MKQSIQLANRFREILLDGKWVVATNFQEQLSDLSWEQATTKIDGLNTIADLTFHVDYYISGILNELKGGSFDIHDQLSFVTPEISSQKDWKKLVEKIIQDAEEFASLIGKLSDSKLEEVFVDKKYGSYQKNINAMIEHSYYHLGQIVMIKKLLNNSTKGKSNTNRNILYFY